MHLQIQSDLKIIRTCDSNKTILPSLRISFKSKKTLISKKKIELNPINPRNTKARNQRRESKYFQIPPRDRVGLKSAKLLANKKFALKRTVEWISNKGTNESQKRRARGGASFEAYLQTIREELGLDLPPRNEGGGGGWSPQEARWISRSRVDLLKHSFLQTK